MNELSKKKQVTPNTCPKGLSPIDNTKQPKYAIMRMTAAPGGNHGYREGCVELACYDDTPGDDPNGTCKLSPPVSVISPGEPNFDLQVCNRSIATNQVTGIIVASSDGKVGFDSLDECQKTYGGGYAGDEFPANCESVNDGDDPKGDCASDGVKPGISPIALAADNFLAFCQWTGGKCVAKPCNAITTEDYCNITNSCLWKDNACKDPDSK